MAKYKAIVNYTFRVEYIFDGPESLAEAAEWAEKKVSMTTSGLSTLLTNEQCKFNVDVNGKKSLIRINKEK